VRRLAVFLLLGLLAACAPLGGPEADRGIGGTGQPGGPAQGAPLATADRGIGGTGGPAGSTGTGIVGVITGFGSIIVNGLEVDYDAATTVEIDGASATPAALRKGQVVVIDATGPTSALDARSVSVRHEVSGPVEAVSDGGTKVEVAGQNVAIEGPIGQGAALRPGAWLAVSGLRRPDGSIEATRVDAAEPGLVSVHGRLAEGPGGLGIGALRVVPAPGVSAVPGQYVTVTGRYSNGRLVARSVAPDLVAADPFAHFGPHVGRVFVESYVSAVNGRLRTPGGLSVSAARSLGAARLTPSWAVLTLERQSGATPRATGLRFLARPTEPPAAPPLRPVTRPLRLERSLHQGSIEGFRPAPVPARLEGANGATLRSARGAAAPYRTLLPEAGRAAGAFPGEPPRKVPPLGGDFRPACRMSGGCGPMRGP